MVEDSEARGREDPWLHMGILQGTYRVRIHSKEFGLHLKMQISWPCECDKWQLRQYVKAYSEFMLEIRHMHELDRVCHFVMGLLTWAKCKLEENWPASLSEAIMKVEGFSDVGWGEKFRFKKENKFPHKKARHEGD